MKVILFFTLACIAQAKAALPSLQGVDLVSEKTVALDWKEAKKGSVVVFLSSVCPCSHSHVSHLVDLSKEFPEIKFIGVHSNANESVDPSKKYFQAQNLPFPVIQDTKTEWADRLKAYRTPHAFLITPEGEIAYQGGVTSSANAEKADMKYLQVTLKKFVAGEKIDSERSRVLGCQIARD